MRLSPMVFGGLQKNSLIDYPGKLCCVLFVAGCNFDCPYCHNPELALGCPRPSQSIDEDRVFSFLETRRHFLDGVVISGGEPTLLNDLASLCRRIKQLGYPVKLDTNGSRPEMIRRLIGDGLVDYISMDIKTDPAYYPLWIQKSCRPESIMSSIRTILASAIPHEFRTTCIRPLIEVQIVEKIARLIKGAALYALQEFRDRNVLHPDIIKNRCSRFSRSELSHLKSVAEPWVNACVVR